MGRRRPAVEQPPRAGSAESDTLAGREDMADCHYETFVPNTGDTTLMKLTR
jgi:hypothetical protein